MERSQTSPPPRRSTLSAWPRGYRWLDDVFDPAACGVHLQALLAETPWASHPFRAFGRTVPMPRRIAFYGAHAYAYSGVVHPACPLTPRLEALRGTVQEATGVSFNVVLLNLYRDGADSMGWHSDDDYDPGRHPEVASVSFGAVRRFRLRRKDGGGTHAADLTPGGVLLMEGGSQVTWAHAVPKTRRAVGPRVNLTFRHMAGSNVPTR